MRALTKRLASFCVAGAMVFSVSACSSETENSTTNNSSSAQTSSDASSTGPIEITDVTGNTVKLEKPLENAVIHQSGSGGPLLTMAALDRDNYASKIGAMDTGLEANRADLWELLIEATPELAEIPKIGDPKKDEVTAEQLLTMGVDGIIVPVSQKVKMDPIAEKVGIPVLYVNYHKQSLDTHLQSTEIIAKATGLTKNLEAINQFYSDVVGDIEDRAKNLNRDRSAYIEVGSTGPEEAGNSYGAEMMWGAILEDVGANNIATEFLASDQAEPLTAEQVLVSNPDIIIITGSTWADQPTSAKMGFSITEQEANDFLTPYRSRDGWDKLKAIKNNELYGIGHPMTRDMIDFYSYAQLAKLFHPEEFADIDPDALMNEYFDKFMPISFQGTWFIKNG